MDFPTEGEPSGDVLVATRELTSEEILSLNSSPVEIVAAPGEGKRIAVLAAVGQYTIGLTNYGGGDNDIDLIHPGQEGSETAETGFALEHIFVPNASVVRRFTHTFGPSNGPHPASEFENKALIIRCENSDPTDGDGTLKISVYYTVADPA